MKTQNSQTKKQKSSPKFIGLQVELIDLTYEKSLEQCPVPNQCLERQASSLLPLLLFLRQEGWAQTHLLPWMGLLLTVRHSDDPASRE